MGLDIEKLAETCKAMGDPTRLTILNTLKERGRTCVTDIAKAADMDAPKVSFHLTRLTFAGLVVGKREGQRVIYELVPEGFQVLAQFSHECSVL